MSNKCVGSLHNKGDDKSSAMARNTKLTILEIVPCPMLGEYVMLSLCKEQCKYYHEYECCSYIASGKRDMDKFFNYFIDK